MRKAILLLTSMAAALLLATGAAPATTTPTTQQALRWIVSGVRATHKGVAREWKERR